MSIACLSNIIGLTRTKCNCPKIDGVLTDYNVSDSGYYIGDEINVVDGVYNDCSNTSFLATLQTIRTRASNEFLTDIQASMMGLGYKSRGGYTGFIGDGKWNETTTGSTFLGVILRGKGIEGATVDLKKIMLGWSTTGENVAVSIYDGDEYSIGTLIETVNITTLASNFVSVNLSQTRTFDISDSRRRIYIVYTGHATGQPLNNKITCGCGSNSSPAWLSFMTSQGAYSTTLNGIRTDNYGGEYMQGLMIDGEVKCDGLSFLCSTTSESNILKKIIAKAINNKAVAMLAQFILDQQNINFYTLLHREALYGKRNHYEKEYKEILDWLKVEIPKENPSCFICQSNQYKLTEVLI